MQSACTKTEKGGTPQVTPPFPTRKPYIMIGGKKNKGEKDAGAALGMLHVRG